MELNKKAEQVIIIGAGIGGLTTAIALQNAGIECRVFERAPQLRALGAGISLGKNAIEAYSHIGMAEEITAKSLPFNQALILDFKGKPISHIPPESIRPSAGAGNYALHRADLIETLLDKIPKDSVLLGKSLIRFEQDKHEVKCYFRDGTNAKADLLIAADGIRSAVRGQLSPQIATRFAGYTCWRAVVSVEGLNIPMDQVTETWGPRGRFGIVPLLGNKVYYYACINSYTANNPKYKSYRPKDLALNFKDYHYTIPLLLENTPEERLIWNDIIDIPPPKTMVSGRVALLGDAAHATTPNLGQGACQAIEDGVLLAQLLRSLPQQEALKIYQEKRIPRVRFITKRSWQIGQIAQTNNRFAVFCRNLAMRFMPRSIREKEFKKILRYPYN